MGTLRWCGELKQKKKEKEKAKATGGYPMTKALSK